MQHHVDAGARKVLGHVVERHLVGEVHLEDLRGENLIRLGARHCVHNQGASSYPEHALHFFMTNEIVGVGSFLVYKGIELTKDSSPRGLR